MKTSLCLLFFAFSFPFVTSANTFSGVDSNQETCKVNWYDNSRNDEYVDATISFRGRSFTIPVEKPRGQSAFKAHVLTKEVFRGHYQYVVGELPEGWGGFGLMEVEISGEVVQSHPQWIKVRAQGTNLFTWWNESYVCDGLMYTPAEYQPSPIDWDDLLGRH